MEAKKTWLDREGGLLFLFVPFLIGFLLCRFFGKEWGADLSRIFPFALLLLVFAGASVYGFVTLSATFLFFGFFAAEQMSGLSLRGLTAGGEELPLLLALLPWFPGIFAAAQLGLQNCSCLMGSGVIPPGLHMKKSLMTSLLQCLILCCAAFASRWIKML